MAGIQIGEQNGPSRRVLGRNGGTKTLPGPIAPGLPGSTNPGPFKPGTTNSTPTPVGAEKMRRKIMDAAQRNPNSNSGPGKLKGRLRAEEVHKRNSLRRDKMRKAISRSGGKLNKVQKSKIQAGAASYKKLGTKLKNIGY